MEQICKECKNEFVITDKEKGWLLLQGFQLPKRCITCRKTRRNRQQATEDNHNWHFAKQNWMK